MSSIGSTNCAAPFLSLSLYRPRFVPFLPRVCIIAGDISPVDVITPIPIMCEDRDIPYIYVNSKEVRSLSSPLHPTPPHLPCVCAA